MIRLLSQWNTRRVFYRAAAKGNTATVISKLRQNVDINASDRNGNTALWLALRNHHEQTAVALVERGANPEDTIGLGWSPLMSAALNGYRDLLEVLLRRGVPVNVSNNGIQTALIAATIAGQVECVRLLVEYGADVNMGERLHYTPLMFAAGTCKLVTVDFLIHHGANVNAMSDDRMTPLRIAQRRGREEIIALLTHHGALEEPYP